jgi:hypothetical protein
MPATVDAAESNRCNRRFPEGPRLVAGVHDLQSIGILDRAIIGFPRQHIAILQYIDLERMRVASDQAVAAVSRTRMAV